MPKTRVIRLRGGGVRVLEQVRVGVDRDPDVGVFHLDLNVLDVLALLELQRAVGDGGGHETGACRAAAFSRPCGLGRKKAGLRPAGDVMRKSDHSSEQK